jgi:hypothetical protein
VTTRQIRAEPADTFVHHNDTAIVLVTNVRTLIMGMAVAAIMTTVVATVDVDGSAVVEETATKTKATPAADRDC